MFYKPTDADRRTYEDMSILVLTPCGGYANPFQFTKSLVNMVAYSWLNGLAIHQMGGTQRMVVHWARNDMARQALQHINEYTGRPFTHILWLDDDHVFNPDLAVYLARHKELDMVSALYYGRSRHLPIVYVKDYTDDPYKHFPLIEVPGNLIEVDAVGFGACLMRLDVLQRMEDPWFQFNNAGEDIYFCVHAKRKGIRIWCDGSYMLGHIGDPQIITHDTHLQYMKDNADEFKDRVMVPLGIKG